MALSEMKNMKKEKYMLKTYERENDAIANEIWNK